MSVQELQVAVEQRTAERDKAVLPGQAQFLGVWRALVVIEKHPLHLLVEARRRHTA